MARQDRGKLDDTLAAMFSNIEYRTDYLFYAHMVGQCSIKMRPDLPAPAAVAFNVDHYNLYINQESFDKYSLIERLAILKHEMLHILYGHLQRIDDRHGFTWNLATDCSLNQHIVKEHLPTSCVLPDSLGKLFKINVPNNKSAEFYYDLIREEVEKKQEEQNNGGDDQQENQENEQNGGGFPQTLDDHAVWEESVGDKDLQQDMTKKMITRAQEETIKGKGTVPSDCSDWLELVTRKSEVNWKKVLRGIIGNKRVGKRPTIMRQDRRFPEREELRGKTRDRVFNLLVIADVSGSMSDEAVLSTLGEVRHICDITKTEVDLIQIDTVAYEPEKLSKKTKLIQRLGNGGTELSPALSMAKKHNIDYQAVVVLTDGGLWEGDIEPFQRCGKKVIWLVEQHGYVLPKMNSGRMKAFKLTGK